ncbi:MAG: hypothetical protein R3E08_01995 [Thiotrichaceae bacterium]
MDSDIFATFILHKQPKYLRTICLEFFGSNLKLAVPAIVEIKNYVDSSPKFHVREYFIIHIRAVKYSNWRIIASPKMLLLIDLASENDVAIGAVASHIVKLANARGAEGFVAITPEARHSFWQALFSYCGNCRAYQCVQAEQRWLFRWSGYD